MKRLGAILSIVALMVALSTSLCFGSSLTIESSYPKDGSTGASIENLGVKLYFSEDLSESEVGKANKECFQLYDEEGKKLPTRVLYHEGEKGVVLVLLDTSSNKQLRAKSNSEYTLKISGDLVSDKGNTLGKDETITFKTLNQSANSMISIAMMVVMFGGMMVVSTRAAKKTVEEAKKKEEVVNPYKEAKKTGKSVEEIVEKDQKKKAKQAEKAAKKAAKEEENLYYYEEEDINKYRVSERRSAYAAGSKYAAARKAEAEKARAEKNAKKASKGKKKK